ncbi:hypothetical protein KW787_02415 [Candidatus Pacearchaeota archaeon]|nr:hypothetical protein [Candidatus Pacearchaeota archaeon]
METMTSIRQVFSLVAVLALAVLTIASVSALGSVSQVEVNGVNAASGAADVATFAGQTLAVKVVFSSSDNATDVRVKAWISGDKDVAASTERFDVLAGLAYSRFLSVKVPFDLDTLHEPLTLNVVVEGRSGIVAEDHVSLSAQRESYLVEILDVNVAQTAQAGQPLALDVVLKNRGLKFADDTFVRATIAALGIEEKAYFGDLAPLDQSNPDKDDASERRMILRIPSNAPAGIYSVDIEAYNADSSTTVTKKVAIGGAADGSTVISPATAKAFAPGQTGEYSLTLVNTGDRVQIYDVAVNAPDGLTTDVSDSIVVVPAGTSRTVKIQAMASKAGVYPFTVTVNSDGQLVKSASFVANVEGNTSLGGTGSNATVLLTVVLAIIFVVLLVVLIVLLTRKPAKTEEFGESYY